MAHSFAKKSALFASIVAVSAAASGCSNGAPPSDPEDQIAYVQDAIEAPSGTVDATTMKTLGSLLTKVQGASSIFGVVGSVASSAQCGGTASGASGSGTLDVSCATGGSATGSLTFTATADVSASEVSTMVTVKFDNVCNADKTECVTGDGVLKAEVSAGSVRTNLAFNATITKDGASTKLFFGEEVGVKESNLNAKVVLFDDKNDSYVFVASVGEGGVSTSVEGGNGSYNCTLTAEGGSCSGDATFSF
ncbi:MAG: hypothetical protein U0414_40840 [Polyangiaceae bacterium]